MKKLKPLAWLAAFALSALASAQLPASAKLEVSAKSAIIIDAESGKVLWQKDPDTARFPASTTKIMTAMLLLEHSVPTDVITAPKDIDKVTEASMHLKPGEKISAADMLYAILLRSANDGCVATAIHVAGSVPKFVEMMNKRAKELGCTNTVFNNPHGLNDDKHVTSAADLAIMARAAMRYPAFAQAVRTYRYTIKRDPKISKDARMVNHDKYLMKDPTADGIKTGWTIPAGRCFVGSATRNGYRVITVVLKGNDWQKDHAAMLNWAFAEHAREYAFQPDQLLGPLPVLGGTQSEIHLQPAFNPVHIWKKSVEKNLQKKFEHSESVSAPIKKGQKLGQLTLTDEDGFVQTVDLLAASDVQQTMTSHLVSNAQTAPSYFLICGSLGLGAYYMRVKSRRRMKRRYAKQTPESRTA